MNIEGLYWDARKELENDGFEKLKDKEVDDIYNSFGKVKPRRRGVKKNFSNNWRYYLASLVPMMLFFPVAFIEESVVKPLATIVAVAIGGCVSLIVLQVNTRNEDIKIKEKWIFSIREVLHDYCDKFYRLNDKYSKNIRPHIGLSATCHRFDEDLDDMDGSINAIESVKLISDKFSEGEDEENLRHYGDKLEMLLESSSKSKRVVYNLKMVNTLRGQMYYFMESGSPDKVQKGVMINTFLSYSCVGEISGVVSGFLNNELRQAKRGEDSIRKNIKSLYVCLVSTVGSFIAYIMIHYIIGSGSSGGDFHSFVFYYL